MFLTIAPISYTFIKHIKILPKIIIRKLRHLLVNQYDSLFL